MKRCIGIDFGTTNTIISFRDTKGKLKKMGGKSIPSAIYFESKKVFYIGSEALQKAKIGCREALVTGFKANIKGERYRITAENGDIIRLKPMVISKYFLNKILTDNIQKRFLKIFGDGELTEQDRVVITVPVKFNPEEKQAIKKAASEAYYPNVKIAFEPTAAAIASSKDCQDSIITVYDFGGGTFDVSIIKKDKNGTFLPLEQGGDKQLGGNAISKAIAEHILLKEVASIGIEIPIEEEEFDEEDYGMSYVEYQRNIAIIMETAEEVKKVFSVADEDDIQKFPFIIYYDNKEQMIDLSIERKQFEACIYPLVKRTVDITRQVVDRAVQKYDVEIHSIIMAGGSSQLLLAQRLLKEEFQKDSITVCLNEDVFDLISIGALELAEQENMIAIEEKTGSQFGVAERIALGTLLFETLIDKDEKLPVTGEKEYDITEDMLRIGELQIQCYERDIKAFPKAKMIPNDIGKGINFIETYRIKLNANLKPEKIKVCFSIEKDGTLTLEWKLLDAKGNIIDQDKDNAISFSSDLE